jgi:transcriptional regulator with XRE-family HTH domain
LERGYTLGALSYAESKGAREVGRELWDGGRIKELREASGKSQDELGKDAGIGGTEISRHETNNSKSNPTIAVLARIARALNVPLWALFEPQGHPLPRPGETGHVESTERPRGEGSQLLAIAEAVDGQVRAEDSWRGDIVKAIAVLTRALGRGDRGEADNETKKARR